MYKPFTNDFVSVVLTRIGNTNTTFTTLPFALAGTAVSGTDYAPYAGTATFGLGDLTKTVKIARSLNPIEPSYVGNKSIVASLANNGSTYTVAAASNSQTMFILDDAYPVSSLLYSNALNISDDATNWNMTFVNRDGTDPGPGDYVVDFAFDVTTGFSPALNSSVGTIALPPNGSPTVLRVSYNKAHGIGGAVNLYLTNQAFSGDYAARFNMYVAQGSKLASATEGPLFGINHDGMETNWWAGTTPGAGTGPWSADGVWFWMNSDTGQASDGDFTARTGVANSIPNTGWKKLKAVFGATSFPNVFKNPDVFTTMSLTTNTPGPGTPANASPVITNGVWCDVEIKQVANTVTWTIDKTPIITYQNTNSLYQSGYLMLGYEDPFDSLGNNDAAVYYSNLRVVALGAPTITSIISSGSNVTLKFSSVDGDDSVSSFAVQSSATVASGYADVTPTPTITQDPASGLFSVTLPQNGAQQFYRIRHL
jgi:hypothetical protein